MALFTCTRDLTPPLRKEISLAISGIEPVISHALRKHSFPPLSQGVHIIEFPVKKMK